MIITISRETGSGGHTIGQMLAEKLGYRFYDKEIITEVAREMKLAEDVVMENDEYLSDSTYMDMVSGFVPFSRKQKVPFDKIEEVQEKIIRHVASDGNCIIVGRSADHILRDVPDTLNVFIHADMAHRVSRVQAHEGVTGQEKRIRRELEAKDRSSSAYYIYFTGREWGSVGNYNLSIDTGLFSKEQSAEMILAAVSMLKGGEQDA